MCGRKEGGNRNDNDATIIQVRTAVSVRGVQLSVLCFPKLHEIHPHSAIRISSSTKQMKTTTTGVEHIASLCLAVLHLLLALSALQLRVNPTHVCLHKQRSPRLPCHLRLHTHKHCGSLRFWSTESAIPLSYPYVSQPAMRSISTDIVKGATLRGESYFRRRQTTKERRRRSWSMFSLKRPHASGLCMFEHETVLASVRVCVCVASVCAIP